MHIRIYIKVLIFTSGLEKGGVAEVTKSYIAMFDELEIVSSLTLVVLRSKVDPYINSKKLKSVYTLNCDSRNPSDTLSLFKKSFLFLGSLVKFKKIISSSNHDIVISLNLEPNIMTLILKYLWKLSFKVILTEHTDLIKFYSDKKIFKKIFKSLARLLYTEADLCVGCSDGVVESVRKMYNISDSKSLRVYNPLREDYRLSEDISVKEEKYICSVGRLDNQKGFKELILALSDYLKEKKYMLVIVGEGPSRKELEKVIEECGLKCHVKLYGFINNPQQIVERSWVYVSSSFLEGMGLNIIEALSLRVPVISTDCRSGPREIIAGERLPTTGLEQNVELYNRGILIPVADEVNVFKKALIRSLNLLEDQDIYNRLSSDGAVHVLSYSRKVIQDEWHEILMLVR